jgi:hypothetical protein
MPRFYQTGDKNTLIAHANKVEMHNHYGPETSAQDFYREILLYLESKRILFNPGAVEQREHCIASVLNMKETLSNSLFGNVSLTGNFTNTRDDRCCNAYLDKVGFSQGRAFIITSQNMCDWFDNSPNGSLGRLAGTFRSVIKKLEDEYGLRYSKKIW